jgi:endonuclease VIII
MPEGDTIFRTADNLRRWLGGREITGASASVPGVDARRLVGLRVESVEARAKHLLVRFSDGVCLHTHQGMTGAWYVYPAGARWRKPAHQARVVLEAGDRVAVCFSAPVVELLTAEAEGRHHSLSRLGPDVLIEPFDLGEVRRRAAFRPADMSIGELLLDQQVVSGIGNVYRCEALFLCRLHPWSSWSALDGDAIDAVVAAASQLMRANIGGAGRPRDFGGGSGQAWVYGRTGRPCRRCRMMIQSSFLAGRRVYWCPSCQSGR